MSTTTPSPASATKRIAVWLDSPWAMVAWTVVAAVFLGVQCLQGLTVHDSGVYLAGYRHFASEPMVNAYLGQWYLSYLLMSWLCRGLGLNSFIALRMIHVVLCMAVQVGIYCWLGKVIRRQWVLLGLILATVCFSQGYTEVNYNELSVAMLTLVAALLCHGIDRNRWQWVAAAGVATALAVAMRTVNVWFVILPVAAMAAGKSGITRLQVATAWIGGGAVGAAAVLAIAAASGTFNVISVTAEAMLGMGSQGESTHGMASLAALYLHNNIHLLRSALILAAIVAAGFGIAALAGRLQGKKWATVAAVIMTPVMALAMAKLNNGPLPNYAVSISVAALIAALFTAKGQVCRVAAVWLTVIALFPLGSASSYGVLGMYLTFVPLPIAVAEVARWCASNRVRVAATSATYAALCGAMLLLNVKHGLFQDQKRELCRFTINSNATGPILTNEANAQLHNELIKRLKPIIPRDQHLICNFSLPLISMLDCRPYAYFESEWIASNGVIARYLDIAHEASGLMPAFLIDVDALNQWDKAAIDHCRSITHYRETWRWAHYRLLTPAN